MAGRTRSAHFDEALDAQLTATSQVEGRTHSQIVAVATKFYLELSPGARRALVAMDAAGTEEREFFHRSVGRATMKAREKLIASKQHDEYKPVTNLTLDTEEAIESEAVAALRRD